MRDSDLSEADEPDALLHRGEPEPGCPGGSADWRTSIAVQHRGVHEAAAGTPHYQESVSRSHTLLCTLIVFM